MEVDSEETAGASASSGVHPRTVFARLGHAGLSPLVLGEVHPPHTAVTAATSYQQQQLYLNSLYSQHQVNIQELLDISWISHILSSKVKKEISARPF